MNKFNNLENNLKESISWLQKELRQISTGQANPMILDSVYVDSYGSRMQVMHVANIALDGNSLKISPWDKSQLKLIEQAIRDADLGLSLVTESDGIRAIFPQLTSETRQKFVKQAKEKLEDARIKVRQIRMEVKDELGKAEKEGEISEDEVNKKESILQDKVDATNRELEEMFKVKEAAILKI